MPQTLEMRCNRPFLGITISRLQYKPKLIVAE
jgi:hypothetical protein